MHLFILCVSGLYDEDVYLYYGDTIKLTLGNLFLLFISTWILQIKLRLSDLHGRLFPLHNSFLLILIFLITLI